MEPQYSVIISCFNEEDNIERCVRSVVAACPDAEVLVVHGGTDRTGEITLELAQKFEAEHGRKHVSHHIPLKN